MALRLIVPADEDMVPSLLDSEIVRYHRPNVRENEKEKSPGFQASEFQAKQVSELIALGVPIEKISKILQVSVALLKFYYGYEFEVAESLVNAKVAKVALDMALSGRNPDMTQFWLKARAGWMEKQGIELTGADGGPIELAAAREGLMKVIANAETNAIEAESTVVSLVRAPDEDTGAADNDA